MNVIFLDFDGVLDTVHYSREKDVERRIKILSDICKECNCKVVIEAAAKVLIDEDTMKTDSKFINFIFDCFNKYGIECIGRTPNVEKKIGSCSSVLMWKEDEILLYLSRHPEIEHYCVIDDDDLGLDLVKVKDHLVKTIDCSDNREEEGLLEKHKEEVSKIIKMNNKIKN